MRLLVDRDINAALQQSDPIATGLRQPLDNGLGKDSQVQPASLTFTVGEIFIPGTKPDDLGGCNKPRSIFDLEQGRTAVIRTRETIHLNWRQTAIGFPPSFQSLQGLLMTNPGLVDPGYSGPLHCTVINMAKENFHLEKGDHIMRLVVFELPPGVGAIAPYHIRAGRHPRVAGASPINEELLDRLSVDFVDVEKRAIEAADKQMSKAQNRALLVPIGTALVAGVLSFGATYFTSVLTLREELHKFREEYAGLRTKFDQYERYDDRLKKLEDRLSAALPPPPPPRIP